MQEKVTISIQLQTLKEAYTFRILRVKYCDTEITYQSMGKMKELENLI